MTIIGKRIWIEAENIEAVKERLESAQAKFEIVATTSSALEVRYESSLRADHLLAEFILPPTGLI